MGTEGLGLLGRLHIYLQVLSQPRATLPQHIVQNQGCIKGWVCLRESEDNGGEKRTTSKRNRKRRRLSFVLRLRTLTHTHYSYRRKQSSSLRILSTSSLLHETEFNITQNEKDSVLMWWDIKAQKQNANVSGASSGLGSGFRNTTTGTRKLRGKSDASNMYVCWLTPHRARHFFVLKLHFNSSMA